MNLTVSQARRIVGLFPGEPEVSVLDARGPALDWSVVRRRSLSADGVVIQPGPSRETDTPVAALAPPGGLSSAAREALARVAVGRPLRAVVAGADGTLLHHGRALDESAEGPPPGLRVTLTGRRQLDLDHLPGLPASFWATLPTSPARRVVRVEGGPAAGGLPDPAWLAIDGAVPAGPVELEIDADPGPGGGWSLRHNGRMVGRALIGPPVVTPTRRLYLVLDRTCPDADRWSDARQLVRGQSRAADRSRVGLGEFTRSEGAGASATEPASRLGPLQAELNAAIRRGVSDGLRDGLAASVEVHFVWFADTHGAGLDCPVGVSLPHSRCGWSEAAVGPETIGAVVANATFLPGLDLWDALDDALAGVVEAVHLDGPGPVVVVGNSPPPPPEDPHHPFTRLWRFDLPPSSLRSRGRIHEILADLDALGCPVLVVFLTDHQATDEYRSRQRLIRSAFERVADLVAAPATADGVAGAVRQACRRLAEWPSGVDLRSEGDQ